MGIVGWGLSDGDCPVGIVGWGLSDGDCRQVVISKIIWGGIVMGRDCLAGGDCRVALYHTSQSHSIRDPFVDDLVATHQLEPKHAKKEALENEFSLQL